jgi:hypothetical protein
MKRLTGFALFFFILNMMAGQVLPDESTSTGNERLFQPKKFDYHLSLGSEFTTTSGFGSALNTYVTPSVSYTLNNRLRIGGGLSIIQTNYFNARSWYNETGTAGSSGNFTSALIYVDGQYLVNDRLSIYGSAFKQFAITPDPLPYNPFNPVSPNGAQGIDLSIGYKVSDHFSFQLGFRYSDGVNPYYQDPFNTNPFRTNAFGSPSHFGAPRW